MPIPDFQSIMLPLLKYFSDKKEHSTKEAIDHLGKYFGLTEEELSLQLPSGKQNVFYNRVHWAIAHLNIAKLLINTKRAHYKISDNGLSLLNSNPPLINLKFLKSIPEYVEHIKSHKKEKNDKTEIETELETDENITPLESLEYAYQKLKKSLAQELLSKVKSMPASFFEKLVIELLVKMGYGGSIKDAGKAIGKSGDEGIDGIIKEDKLGLDVVYIQAKRWEGAVGRPELQKFVGALAGQGAKKEYL